MGLRLIEITLKQNFVYTVNNVSLRFIRTSEKGFGFLNDKTGRLTGKVYSKSINTLGDGHTYVKFTVPATPFYSLLSNVVYNGLHFNEYYFKKQINGLIKSKEIVKDVNDPLNTCVYEDIYK